MRGEYAVAGGPAPDWPLHTARLTLRPYREDGLAGPAGSVSQLDLGFETYGLHRVVAQMDARNPTPARMAGTLHTALRLVSPVDHPRQPRRPARAANSSRQASTSVASHTRFRR